MSEAILVLLRHPEEARSLLGAAAGLAETMGGARVNTLAVCETDRIAPSFSATLAERAAALLDAKEEEHERVVALRGLCDAWTARAVRPTTDLHWFEAEGSTTDIVTHWGRRADVIVAGRPSPGDWLGQQMFKSALLGTDRPVLMVPLEPAVPATGAASGRSDEPMAPSGAALPEMRAASGRPGDLMVPQEPALPEMSAGFGGSIAIAWRDEKQTLRAVLPALRWLTSAREVHVLVGVHDTAQSPELPPVLMEHGVRANLHVLSLDRSPFGQTLLAVAHDLGVDLLVMGAYVHSPLRGLIFGGVTRHMLAAADLPVLMRH
ncbi:MAG TPA: universal stress protein [Stellaceae bacterium]|nr:universal stress protein [Stellaceae bacterium]